MTEKTVKPFMIFYEVFTINGRGILFRGRVEEHTGTFENGNQVFIGQYGKDNSVESFVNAVIKGVGYSGPLFADLAPTHIQLLFDESDIPDDFFKELSEGVIFQY